MELDPFFADIGGDKPPKPGKKKQDSFFDKATGGLDPFFDEDRGALLSFLDTVSRPGQVVKNLVTGRGESALRQGGQFVADVVDASLPGDWLPNDIARSEDHISGAETIGLEDEGFWNKAAGFGVDVLTDPLSWVTAGAAGAVKGAATQGARTALKVGLPFGKGIAEIPGSAKAIEAVGGAIKKGYGKLPEGLRRGATKLKTDVKETMGWLSPNEGAKGAIGGARALRTRAMKAGQKEASRIMGALPDNLQVMVSDVIENINVGDDGVSVLRPDAGRQAGAIETIDQQLATLRERLALHPEFANLDDAVKGQVGQAIEDSIRLGHTQYLDDIKHGALAAPQGVDVANASPRNYLQRLFDFPEDAEVDAMRGAGIKATKKRKLDTDEKLVEYLNEPGALKGYERNAFKRLLSRSGEQGRMLEKASIARHVLGDKFDNLVNGVHRTAEAGEKVQGGIKGTGGHFTAKGGEEVYDKSVTAAFDEAIEAMAQADPESARALANAYHGAKARMPILEVLAYANRWFKPAAVYGVIVPKMGSIVRNDLGTTWQTLTTQGLAMAGKNLARMPRRMWDSINDGTAKAFGWKHYKPQQLTKDIDLIESAYAGARGSEEAVMTILESAGRSDLAEAVRHGVLDGFVSMEEIMRQTASSAWWKKKAFDIYHAPAAVFQGVEQRARLGNFLDRLATHKDAGKAAAEGKEAFLDYNIGGSAKNRTLRDLVPFAAFMTGSIKQQGKFLAKKPAAAVAMSSLFGDQADDPVYPHLEGKLNIPIGQDEKGDQEYISGLGLPIEALNQIPGSFRDFKRNIIGSSHPLAKSLWGALSGEDPYFETPYGEYSKLPGNVEGGDFGKFYNKAAGTGLIQPLDSLWRMFGKATDNRRSAGVKALDLLTGANVVSVDEDRALQQQLQDALRDNPDVRQHRGFYATDDEDDATGELIRAYNRAKSQVRKKRKKDDD